MIHHSPVARSKLAASAIATGEVLKDVCQTDSRGALMCFLQFASLLF